MESNLSSTLVGQLVTERPRRAHVLERYGIDYCCDGKRTLKDACAAKTLDLDEVLNELRAVDVGPEDADQIDWSRRPMSEPLSSSERRGVNPPAAHSRRGVDAGVAGIFTTTRVPLFSGQSTVMLPW